MRRLLHFIFTMSLSFLVGHVAAADLKKIEKGLTDSVITTKITAKFTKNTTLNPLKISVSTNNGVVTLSGHVNDKQAFVDALRLAKTTRGVKTVDVDELEIKQVNNALTDAYITAKVEASVLKAKVFDDESIPIVGINATTDNGIVTLTGDLKNDDSLTAILNRVNAVNGVKKIVTRLRVVKEG